MAIKVESLTYKDTEYELIPPAPTSTERGGIIASTKTSDYTTEVKLGSDGKLYVPSGLKSSDLYRGTFESGNLDDLKTKGIYWFRVVADVTGTKPTPDGNYGMLEVFGAGTSEIVQRWTQYNTGKVYTRSYVNSAWTAWATPAIGDFLPLSGGTMTGGIDMGGHRILGLYGTGDSAFNSAGIEIREQDGVGNTAWNIEKAPTLGFHWANTAAGTLVLGADKIFRFKRQDGGIAILQANLDSIHRGTLESNANIDNLSCGVYWCSLSSSNGGTIPVADYGVLEVMSNENSTGIGNLQRFTTYSNGNKVYVRLRANGTWSSWKLLAGSQNLAASSSTLIGTASSGFNITIDAKYHSLYLTGSVGSSGTMNLMFDMRYPRAGLSVSQSMAHGNSSINFTVSGSKLTSSGSSNGVSVYGLYYS